METKVNVNKKRMGLGKMCLISLITLLSVTVVIGGFGLAILEAYHRAVRSLSLNAVDFKRLRDGIYVGEYADGMYKWRTNKTRVTVSNGLVNDIEILDDFEFHGEESDLEMMYERVITSQSLYVDTVSGATLTSKSILRAVENALVQAN